MSMKTLKPKELATVWNAESIYDRVEECRFMLKVHGFLSEGESDRVIKRIDKWLAMHGMRRYRK